ncbi:MAG: glycoside hydrolase [Lentisphaerae bacterium]|jgi:alpha-L-fucosidase|nr:glycoside hydrolase [Lentisphaerota bacterium]
MKKFNDGRDWFFEKRFGLFVHWGPYCVGGLQEQEIKRYKTPWSEYVKYVDRFTAERFDPADWLDMAQAAGMEYITFTTKHGDEFCMWDTQETRFNIMNSPYGKDILAELAAECHKRDFPLVLYYSNPHWNAMSYPDIDAPTPMADNFVLAPYVAFIKRQLRELCTNYGKISGIWFDGSSKFEDPSINAMIRELQPTAVINNRGFSPGDFSTPERAFLDHSGALPFATPTEACNAVGWNSWGYREKEDYYSARYFQGQMAMFMARGANYLLNLGPRPDGTFPPEAVAVLEGVGDWYCRVKSALTAPPCPGAVDANQRFFSNPGDHDNDILLTGGGHELNLIMTRGTDVPTVIFPGLETMPESATLLNTGEPLEVTTFTTGWMAEWRSTMTRLRGIPVEKLYGEVPVIRLTFKEPIIRAQISESVVCNATDEGQPADK